MSRARISALLLAAVAVAGCDDQVKRIPIFKTMSWQVSEETFEAGTARDRVAGTMAIDDERTYGLLEADSALVSPLEGTDAEVAHGAVLFGQFCRPCHGVSGAGDGTVVGPNRIPELPLLNLRSELTRSYSDGYLWGMVTNGRGLMPSYRRIPAHERWYLVAYLRRLQADAVAAGEIPPLEPAGTSGGSQ